jgi:hypothetical protein
LTGPIAGTASGTFADSEFVTIPVLQRTTSLRFVLRCARETLQVFA